jgi:O-acetyl-ADP-ribose deacetylase (regulator of RNase III)
MIISSQGNLLDANVDALVNTVNCVGVMGKGIALQFKRRYPAVFKAYEKACRDDEVQIGKMFVVETEQIEGPRFVVNFPTKKHWRSPSKLEYIEAGLDDLKRVIRELGIESIAIPPLGAGNGGLDWTAVEPVIRESLHDLDEVRILIYAPADQPRSIAPSSSLRMTRVRAMLLTLLNDYVHQRQVSEPWEDPRGASHLEIQKLMYFANVHDESLKLDFAPGRYGPYSEKVRHLVQDMEGGYLSGFGDGTGTVMALEPIAPTSEGLEALSASEGSYPDPTVLSSSPAPTG